MKTAIFKKYFILSVTYLYVLLFVYAAMSKVLDFENFRAQLGQSPLLSAFADYVSWMVPVIEFTIVALLVFQKYRLLGLYGAFSLMSAFSAYIFIILNFSSFVPCSCGGILENMGWHEHLIFNIAFVILAAVAILMLWHCTRKSAWKFTPIITLAILATSALAIVTILFVGSDSIMQYHNKFQRRFPHLTAIEAHKKDLRYNSYYFAGVDSTFVYLGNTTAPLLLTQLDPTIRHQSSHQITLDRREFLYRSIQLRVAPPYFYVFDGTVPCVYLGKVNEWNAKFIRKNSEYFSQAVPMDPDRMAIRILKRGSAENILATMDLRDTSALSANEKLLEKQIDGVFDTDGRLGYSAGMDRLVYLYAYRNQYIVADREAQLDFRDNTIDTITRAQLDIIDLHDRGEKKFGKRPLLVNKNMAVFENLLFVDSAIPGKYEDPDTWKSSSIIDVYDLLKHRYLLSFYIPAEDGEKIRSLAVYNDKLYTLAGQKLAVYKLGENLTKYYEKKAFQKQ